MGKVVRRLFIGLGAVVGLLVLMVVGLALFFDVNHYKPQIETAVAKSTGMNLKIAGKASLKVFPQIRIALKDVHLSNQGSELFKGDSVEVVPQLIPFVRRRELIVNSIVLKRPSIHIEKSRAGKMNFQSGRPSHTGQAAAATKAPAHVPSNEIHSVSIDDGDLSYIDRSTGEQTLVKGVNATFSGIRWGGGGVSLSGKLKAHSLQSGQLAASNLKADIRDDHGLVNLTGTEASAFGGSIQGSVQLDVRGSVPKLKIDQKASHIDLAKLPSGASGRVSGIADGSMNLAASGKDSQAIIKTAVGDVSVRSQKLMLAGVDVDDLAGKLKTAQGLDLARVGVPALSGLLAPALGQAAGKVGGSPEKKTEIRKLVSDWKISGGVAQAKDVALATSKTTVAFSGGINLISKTYQKFFIATVDPKGCSKTKIEVSGALNNPRPTAGSVGEQLSRSYLGQAGIASGGATGNLGSQIAGLLGGGKKEAKPESGAKAPAPANETPSGCDHFYTGSALQVG